MSLYKGSKKVAGNTMLGGIAGDLQSYSVSFDDSGRTENIESLDALLPQIKTRSPLGNLFKLIKTGFSILNSNLAMKITSGSLKDKIGALPPGKYAGYYSSSATETPSSWGTFEANVIDSASASITVKTTVDKNSYTAYKNSGRWSEWEKNVTNSDLDVKTVSIAAGTNNKIAFGWDAGKKQIAVHIDGTWVGNITPTK